MAAHRSVRPLPWIALVVLAASLLPCAQARGADVKTADARPAPAKAAQPASAIERPADLDALFLNSAEPADPLAGLDMPGRTVDYQSMLQAAGVGFEASSVVADLKTGTLTTFGPHVSEAVLPASTFKLITAYYLLDHGIVVPGSTLLCAPFTVSHHRVHCWRQGGHGEIDLAHAIALSCNGFFYRSYTPEVWRGVIDLAVRMGYRHDPAEEPRDLPDALAHGDGLKITPLDQMRFFMGLVPAHIPEAFKGPPSPLTNEAAKTEIRRGMELAVLEGSGKRCLIPGLSVAGKTGSFKGGRWFVCYTPADRPRLVIVTHVMGGSIHSAVDVTRRFLEQVQSVSQGEPPRIARRPRRRRR